MKNNLLKMTVISIVLLMSILFVACKNYSITIDPTPSNGSITLDPVTGSYLDGSSVTVTAAPDSGYVFDSWGGDLSGSTNPTTLTMDADKTITATFVEEVYDITIDPTPSNGSITLDPATGPYADGSSVTVTAAPDSGYVFDSWGGDLSGSTNPTTLTMDADKTITATFVEEEYTLTVTLNGNGSYTLDPPGGSYTLGTDVTITANPDSGYALEEWAGDIVSIQNPITVTMNSDKNIQGTILKEWEQVSTSGAIIANTQYFSDIVIQNSSPIVGYGDNSSSHVYKIDDSILGDIAADTGHTNPAMRSFFMDGNDDLYTAFEGDSDILYVSKYDDVAGTWSVLGGTHNPGQQASVDTVTNTVYATSGMRNVMKYTDANGWEMLGTEFSTATLVYGQIVKAYNDNVVVVNYQLMISKL